MEQNFNIKELFRTLQQKFPEMICTSFYYERGKNEGMGDFSGKIPHPKVPSVVLTVDFAHSMANKLDTFGENTEETFLNSGASFLIEVQQNETRIGDYPAILDILADFSEELTILGLPRAQSHPEHEMEYNIIYIHRPPGAGFYFPSLSAKFCQDWEYCQKVLALWQRFVSV